MTEILQYINEAAVGCAILTFIVVIIIYSLNNNNGSLEDVLIHVFSASAIPTSNG